jgi:predicted NAD/FAD-binding protein
VIGGGIAGLTAAYSLSRSCDVTLFEAQRRLGGHADTHEVTSADGRSRGVDSGFIVYNERAYPLLVRLFAELGVLTQPTDMSMSVRCDGCGLEYAGGRGGFGLLARRPSAGWARYTRMLAEVPRFRRSARALLGSAHPGAGSSSGDGPTFSSGDGPTFGEFLASGDFSWYFRTHFARPLVSAVWSCAPRWAYRYPARYLFAFLANHGMLGATRASPWRTVVGGSRSYVERITAGLPAVLTGTPVRRVRRLATGVEIVDEAGGRDWFTAAVLATHPDQALAMLAEPTPLERAVLGTFRYSRNSAVLHTDHRLLPQRRGVSASWNYHQADCDPQGAVGISYDLSRLQRLDAPETYLVSLNSDAAIAPDTVRARAAYEHPLYTPESVAAQRRLPDLNDGRLAYAGAYHGWGFHEDGCRSGLQAAVSLGGSR